MEMYIFVQNGNRLKFGGIIFATCFRYILQPIQDEQEEKEEIKTKGSELQKVHCLIFDSNKTHVKWH